MRSHELYENETIAILNHKLSDMPTLPKSLYVNIDGRDVYFKNISKNFVALKNEFISRPISFFVRPFSSFYEKLNTFILEYHQHGLLSRRFVMNSLSELN